MSSRERVVLDTNVIVSALLFTNSTPSKAFFTALNTGEILLSLPLLAEISDVLSRPKFNRYVTREERERFLDALIREASLIDITETVQACRDPKDDKILELAVSGDASYIVSGDKDLLVLSPFRGIPILPPHDFLVALAPE